MCMAQVGVTINISMRQRFIELGFFAITGWYLLLITINLFNQQPLAPEEMLSHDQAFPLLYYQFIQSWAALWDQKLLALRTWAFISMFFAFWVWMRIATISFVHAWQRLVYALCWVSSVSLIYYAAQLKPYSMDVFVAGMYVLFFLDAERLKSTLTNLQYNILVWCLPLGGLVSYPAFFSMALPLWVLYFEGKRSWMRIGGYVAICATVAFLVYWFDVRMGNEMVLQRYWNDYFVSFHSFGDFFKTFNLGLNNLLNRWLAEIPDYHRWIGQTFIGIGFVYMLLRAIECVRQKARMDISVAGLIMVILLLISGLWQRHPFNVPRTSLFLAPLFMVMFVEVLGQFRQRLPKIGTIVIVLFCGYALYVSTGIGRLVVVGDLGAQAVLWK